MANVTKKVKISPNQRYDIADLVAMQDNIENYVARIGQLIGAPLIETGVSSWLIDGVLTYTAINVVGTDLEVTAGLEVITPTGHIITLAANTTVTAGLPFASAKVLMARAAIAGDVDDPASTDNRRFWDSGTATESSVATLTWEHRQLDFRLVDNTFAAGHAAVAAGWVRVATLTTAGVATPTYFFPMNGTGALTQCNSIMGILRRMIGDRNENTGSGSASCGGYRNTNSGNYSASSGGYNNTNSGEDSASSGGYNNTNSGEDSASLGGELNTNSGICSASIGGWGVTGANNTNSGVSSVSIGGHDNSNSGDYSVSSGGAYNTNSGTHSVSLGGSHNTNSGDYSVILGQYCENATDDVICGGYNTTLTPSGANQNLKWVISNRFGTAHFASDFKVGGNVNDGTGATYKAWSTGSFQTEANAYFGGDVDGTTDPKAKIIGATGNAHIGGDVEIGGTVTAGATASTTPTVTITASTGAIAANGLVTAAGGIKTVTPANVVASWNAGTSEFDATMTQVGGVIEVPLDAGHPLPASVGGIIRLRLANTKITSTSRVHVTLEFSGASATKLPACICEVNDTELVVTLFNHGAAAIESSVFVQFDVINPA